MSGTTLAVVTHAIMGIVVVAAATTLLALGDLTESTAIALFTSAIALVGGSATAAVALKVPTAPTIEVKAPPRTPAAK
jgi:hypothetical protein